MKRMIILLAFVMTFAGTARAVTIRLTPNGRESIQAAIDRSKDGDVIVLAAGTYEISKPLKITNRNDFTIRGEGAVEIISSDIYDNVLTIERCERFAITNITAGHSETSYCSGDVVYMEDCKYVDISVCNLYGCGVTGINMYRCWGVNLRNNLIHDNSYAGVMIIECSTIKITGNRFIDNAVQMQIDSEMIDTDRVISSDILLTGNIYIYSDSYGVEEEEE